MVQPNKECENFCYWMLNTSWQPLTPPRVNLITDVYNAAVNFTEVTDQVWKNFSMVSAWRYKYYKIWLSLQTSYCLAAENWFAQLSVQPSNNYKAAVNDLILQLQADNNWYHLDCLWIFATEQQQHARINLVNPGSNTISEIGSPTWAANFGYTGDGASMYLNPNFNASGGVNFLQNSNSMGVYVRTNVSENKDEIGVSNGTTLHLIQSRNSSNALNTVINCGTFFTYGSSDSRGLNVTRRNSSVSSQIYKNGSQAATSVLASAALPNLNPFILARNTSGAAGVFSSKQISMCFFGGASIDQSTFYSAFQTFATTIGFDV